MPFVRELFLLDGQMVFFRICVYRGQWIEFRSARELGRTSEFGTP
jgi:hypothetical protein